MIRLDGVTVMYGDRAALRDVSFHVEAGERVAVIGPNGAGKSTILRAVAGLVRPITGTVELAGERVDRMDRMAVARRNRAFQPRWRARLPSSRPSRPLRRQCSTSSSKASSSAAVATVKSG